MLNFNVNSFETSTNLRRDASWVSAIRSLRALRFPSRAVILISTLDTLVNRTNYIAYE